MLCSVRALWLELGSLLCRLWALSIYSTLFDLATRQSSCHLSGRLLLYAERKKETVLYSPEAVICCWQTQTFLSGENSVATVAWQLAFILERCRDCSQCMLLLKVIHALKGHRAEEQFPSSASFGNQNENPFHQPLLIDVNCFKCSLFSRFCQGFFEVTAILHSSPPWTEQLAGTWSIDISRLGGHPELNAFGLFHLQKLTNGF